MPKILVINKCDLPIREKIYEEDYQRLAEEEKFNAVFSLSALYDRHVEPLREKVLELLPEGEPMYEDDQITNLNKEQWVAEIIREKIFLALRKEVPYTTHVEVEKIEEKEEVIVINAIIYTSESKYKKMIIGAGGRAIKEIGIAARKELEVALNSKVYLELDVQTDKRWNERI
jgi:GTP-binding protein Era